MIGNVSPEKLRHKASEDSVTFFTSRKNIYLNTLMLPNMAATLLNKVLILPMLKYKKRPFFEFNISKIIFENNSMCVHFFKLQNLDCDPENTFLFRYFITRNCAI